MTYKEIEKAVSQRDILAAREGTELLHFLALTGLLKLYSEGIVGRNQASEIKGLLREDYETACQPVPERITREESLEISGIQDKIHHAVLCRGNPWAIMLQACKAISVLMRDNGAFWSNVKEDAYLICGNVLEDAQAYEAEREELLADIGKLIKAASLDSDTRHKHILSRAVDEHRARLAYIDGLHGSGEQQHI
ncbi:MAG: hypothetical protein Q4F79_07540 [Eubacteriales bacterium]|nr:hypothetical protein [Eubacteriales bacterium]